MKILKDIPLSKLVSVDIETVRLYEKYEDAPETCQSAWEYKNKQEGEIPDFEKLSELWEKTASLYAEFSKICAISFVFFNEDEDKLLCKEIYGYDEAEILTVASDLLKRAHGAGRIFIGHAAKFFDFPYMAKRYVTNYLDIPDTLDTAHLKPWEIKNLCTNELWKFGSYGAGSSLQALCYTLGVPSSKNDLVGDEVGKAYYNNEIKRIAKYCSEDAIATMNVALRLRGNKIIDPSEVVYVEQQEDFSQYPLLQRLYNQNSFTLDIEKELREILTKKKPTKKDKKNLREILLGVYLRTDFVNGDQDTKAVKEAKQEEIDVFLDSI